MRDTKLALRIRKTPAGKGVFALRKFRKNQRIGTMTGTVISDDNYDPDYVVDLGKRGVLEPAAPFRFLNHCCDPNSALIEYDTDADEPPTMSVEALRTIQPGEQVTIDYGWPADAAIRCLCGAEACRGWVVSAEELPRLQRRLKREAGARKPRPAGSAKPNSPQTSSAKQSKKPSNSSVGRKSPSRASAR